MSDQFLEALRGPHTAVVDIEAWRGRQRLDVDFAGAKGAVTISADSAVRRKLSVTFPPSPGLWDILSPIGTELRPRRGIRFPNGATEMVPLGQFFIDEQSIGYGPGDGLQITAPDRWAHVQRARFVAPRASTPGITVIAQIVMLLQEVLGVAHPILIQSHADAFVGALVWEQDRDKAILDLAKSIGCEVFFDADGNVVIRDLPVEWAPPVWLANSGNRGVLSKASRTRSRSRTYNVVVASTAATDGTVPFDPVRVGDDDVTSQTYAGPPPFNDVTLAGPFGLVPLFYTSENLKTADQAKWAATVLLQKAKGLSAQLSMDQVVNPAVEAGDVWDIVLPPETPRGVAPVERHVIDSATVPLDVDSVQTVDTRSTRPDDDLDGAQ